MHTAPKLRPYLRQSLQRLRRVGNICAVLDTSQIPNSRSIGPSSNAPRAQERLGGSPKDLESLTATSATNQGPRHRQRTPTARRGGATVCHKGALPGTRKLPQQNEQWPPLWWLFPQSHLFPHTTPSARMSFPNACADEGHAILLADAHRFSFIPLWRRKLFAVRP